MTWPLRLIQYTKETTGATLQVGDAFYADPPADYDHEADPMGWYWPMHFADGKHLSDLYKATLQHVRKPILVFLPGRHLFCVDGACWRADADNKIEYYGGWTVTGSLEAGTLSMAPSINIVGSYHGFLQNNVISDDCEGRQFDAEGRGIR